MRSKEVQSPAAKKKQVTAPMAPAATGPTMASLWQRLEKAAQAYAGKLAFPLRPPAKAKAIAAAEKAMKLTFPADFRESLLVHDGQPPSEGTPTFPWMPGCDHLASLESIVEQWRDEQDDAEDAEEAPVVEGGRFRNLVWHPLRIPIAGSPYWDQDNTYLDLVPGPKGTVGQLVTMTTECDFAILGTSLRDAMERWVTLLESGAWTPDGPKGKKRAGHPADAFAGASKPASKSKRR